MASPGPIDAAPTDDAAANEPRLGVLASGTGTLLEAAIDAGLHISVVVADRECRALDVANAAGVAAELVRRDSFGPGFDRVAYTHRLVTVLESYGHRRSGHGRFRDDFEPGDVHRVPGKGAEHPPRVTAGVQGLARRS